MQRIVEQHIAPTLESRQLIQAAGMEPHAADPRPHIVFVIGECEIWAVPEAADHPVLKGVELGHIHASGSFYRTLTFAKTATLLINGSWQGNVHPVAWTNTYQGGRVFCTTLGHPGHFELGSFNHMLVNAVRWTLAGDTKNILRRGQQ